MKPNIKFIITLLISISLGLLFAWIDSQPNWDDTGILATLLVLTSGVISYYYRAKPLVWGLAVSSWIPILGIIKTGDYSLLMILLIGLIGAYAGFFARKLTAPAKKRKK